MNKKLLPYLGGKSSNFIDQVKKIFAESPCVIFRDRFAGSGRIGFAIAKSFPDAPVELWESDPMLVYFYQAMLSYDGAQREAISGLIETHALLMGKSTNYWEKLRDLASQPPALDSLSAFIVYMHFVRRANPQMANGKRIGAFDSSKVRKAFKYSFPDQTGATNARFINAFIDAPYPRMTLADVPVFDPDGGVNQHSHDARSIDLQERYLDLALMDCSELIYINQPLPPIKALLEARGLTGDYRPIAGTRLSYWHFKRLNQLLQEDHVNGVRN